MNTTRACHADVLVIGFGKGGKTVAATMGRRGKRVVLVERSDRMYGGTCPNVGCVPTKALVHHSGKRRATDPAQDWYERSIHDVQALTALFRGGNFDGAHMLTSADLIQTTVLPRRLAIVGGGYLGIEFASIYRRFGSQVTVLESAPRILGREDDDTVAVAQGILADEGIEIVTGARVTEVRDGASDATVGYERDGRRHALDVDAILAATGRAPATRDLGLDAAGVRTTERGAVAVDEHLRTSQPHIYAVGDVRGGPQHTYLSLDDARIVLGQLVGEGRRSTADRVAIPRTLFMTPPFAAVGLTERAAREAGYRVRIASERVAEIEAMPRAYIVEDTRGIMKFVIDAGTDEILGAALLSVDAQELINTVALAMRHGITAAELRDAVYTHPTSTEAFNEVLATIVRDDEPRVAHV